MILSIYLVGAGAMMIFGILMERRSGARDDSVVKDQMERGGFIIVAGIIWPLLIAIALVGGVLSLMGYIATPPKEEEKKAEAPGGEEASSPLTSETMQSLVRATMQEGLLSQLQGEYESNIDQNALGTNEVSPETQEEILTNGFVEDDPEPDPKPDPKPEPDPEIKREDRWKGLK